MKRIHWRRYVTRKMLVVFAVMVVLQIVEHYLNGRITSKLAEFSFSAVVDHLLFGVPLED